MYVCLSHGSNLYTNTPIRWDLPYELALTLSCHNHTNTPPKLLQSALLHKHGTFRSRALRRKHFIHIHSLQNLGLGIHILH